MKVFRQFFQNYNRSVRDISFYKEVLAKPFFFSLQFLYLLTFFILLLHTLLFTISAGFFLPQLPQAIQKLEERLESLYPNDLVITIQDGVIKTNRKTPVVIDFPELTSSTPYSHFVILDVNATQVEYADKKAMILVTKDGVVYPNDMEASGTRFESASQFGEARITRAAYDKAVVRIENFLAMLPAMAPWFLVVATLMIPIFGSFVVVLWRLIILVILTGILIPVSSLFGNKFTFKELYQMGMHGMAVPISLSLLIMLTGLTIPLVFASSYLLWMVIVLARLSERKATVE